MPVNDAVGDVVRVGRFEWERLMLMSVPHPLNFKLLPLGVFMSADGGRVRPGNAGLALFGPHEKTWAKLLRWAVDEGWLVLVERGGARRGAGGTTVKRASVYAAGVPRGVWERREEVLGAPPFRAAGVEGSAAEGPDPLKGAFEGPVSGAESLKGAPTTPFIGSDGSAKGAPGDSLPGSMKGAFGVFEGSDPSFEGSAQALPHHVVPSRSSSSSTSSSPAGASLPVVDGSGDCGGGGGFSFEGDGDQDAAAAGSWTGEGPTTVGPSVPHPQAEPLVAALDFRGRPPGARQRGQLVALVAAALDAGWAEQDLKTYLDLGGAAVNSAAAVYAHRLGAGELPDPESFRAASRRPLEGTDAVVRGWGDLARRLGAQQPYTDPWKRVEEEAAAGLAPEGAERHAHCADAACDPVARTRLKLNHEGELKPSPCPRCHPLMQF
jgi:hypothetical protein